MYIQKTIIGMNSPDYYCSSEYDAESAWSQYFGNSSQANYNKYYTLYVRAVRAF
jgi:hypothetical protein